MKRRNDIFKHGPILKVAVFALSMCVMVLMSSCGSSIRDLKAEYKPTQVNIDGQNYIVIAPDNLKKVHQNQPDTCWAACMEQILFHHGIEATQDNIVKHIFPDNDPNEEKALTAFAIHLNDSIQEFTMSDGSEVWCRCDVDGGIGGPILLESTLHRKLAFEFVRKRMTMLGIKTPEGADHAVNVVGAIYRDKTVDYNAPDNIVGYIIYDPATTKVHSYSISGLFEITKIAFYFTTYDGAWSAAVPGASAKYLSPWD